MKFYTSYYTNFKNIPKNFLCVQISRTCPGSLEDNENFVAVKDCILAPSAELLSDKKSNKISEDEYKRRYVTELFEKLQNKGYKDLKEYVQAVEKVYNDTFPPKWSAIVFMCYESPDKFCHRHILRNLLTKIYSVECLEYTNYQKTENIEQISSVLF